MWDAREVIVDRDAVLARALVDEACRKSALVWLRPAGSDRAQAVWHGYVDGAVHVVSGGLEQDAPELVDGAEVDVTVRSKDTGGRVLTFRGTVSTVLPDDPAWDGVVTELHAKRLNPPDGEEQPARWVRESRVVRIEPVGRLVEGPGHLSHRSHAAEPPGSPAATSGRLPFVLGRRGRRRSLEG
jgi:hypothetical protein